MIVLVLIDGTEQSLYTLERAAQFLDKEFWGLLTSRVYLVVN
jgi:nucleotide-binding universal stress UspA family protein